MRSPTRGVSAAAMLVAMLVGSGAQAQPYGYYEDRPPPGYYEERPVIIRRAPPPRRGGPVGYNCDAVQQGLTGPQPYSCPLPGPRPLGARCFCDMPIASFSTPQTAVGRVIP